MTCGPAWIPAVRQRRVVWADFADWPAGLVPGPAADGQRREDDGEMRLDGVAQVMVIGRASMSGVELAEQLGHG